MIQTQLGLPVLGRRVAGNSGVGQPALDAAIKRSGVDRADRLELRFGAQTSSPVAQRVKALQAEIARQGLDGVLVSSIDEKFNEYTPLENRRLEAITGFTGSAGIAFIPASGKGKVFVDGRYHTQADRELAADGLFETGKQTAHTGSLYHEFLQELVKAKGEAKLKIGIDPFVMSIAGHKKILEKTGAELVSLERNPVDVVWADRPAPKGAPIYQLPESVTGESVESKLKRVREAIKEKNIQVLPLPKLDQMAWLFNLRGDDIPENPVFMGDAIITDEKAFLFVHNPEARLSEQTRESLKKAGVEILPDSDFRTKLQALSQGKRIGIDPGSTSYGVAELISKHGGQTVTGHNPVDAMKAVKNPVELAGMREANLMASLAKTRTLKWVEDQIAAGKTVTEADVRTSIEGFYNSPLSFDTIASVGDEAAQPHSHGCRPDKPLKDGDLLLLDTGMQYQSKTGVGTTDDTRTVAVGVPVHPDDELRKRYTQVLQGHIACATQVFPEGARGVDLDSYARVFGGDFAHGTGHGVGALLNVHEMPVHLSTGPGAEAYQPKPGHITSIEPGYYQPEGDQPFGIRLENLYAVAEAGGQDAAGKPLYRFEPITFIPFDKRLIKMKTLLPRDKEWLRWYHQQVYEKLSPHMDEAERAWLKEKCAF